MEIREEIGVGLRGDDWGYFIQMSIVEEFGLNLLILLLFHEDMI